ncbi:MAG: diguanylate cyclase [Nitrospirae bacterium]|nr:diguanylate cyclase [Nitrospirota bacterium]
MKKDSRIDRILSHIPLTPKFLIITLLAGVVVWGILEYSQANRLKKITDTQLTYLLQQQAREDRIRFDNYVMAYHDMARLIVSQKAFIDHMREYSGFSDESKDVKYYTEIPSWLPDASVMRHFVRIHNAVLIDGRGRVREVYNGISRTIPQSLLPPSAHLLQISRGQSILTIVDGVHYLIVSEVVKDHNGVVTSVLVLISPLDDEFLSNMQGVKSDKGIIALVEPMRERVVASNVPDLIPEGTPLDTLTDRYLITYKEFFDWGGSEIYIQFTTFVSKDALKEMSRSMLFEGRRQRFFISLALLLLFTMIMLSITRKIHLLVENIEDSSRNILNMRLPIVSKGRDQLRILEERFAMFTGEIIESHERLKKLSRKNESILAAAGEGIIGLDTGGHHTFVNPAAARMLGYSVEELIGKRSHELWHHTKPDGSHHPSKECPIYAAFTDGVVHHETGDVFWRKDGSSFPVEYKSTPIVEQGNVIGAVVAFSDITEMIKLREELKKLSITDALTGFYNRRGFIAFATPKLKLSLRKMEKILLIYADMDNLKPINDNYGHQEGDKALAEIANILKSTFRESDILARLGGDEFAILAIDACDEKVIHERIQKNIDAYNKTVNPVYKLSLSIGIVCYDPGKPCTLDELLSKADTLMYNNKLSKKG